MTAAFVPRPIRDCRVVRLKPVATANTQRTLNIGVFTQPPPRSRHGCAAPRYHRPRNNVFAPCSFELQNKIGSEDKAWCLETRFASYDVLPQSPGTALLLCWSNKFIHETTAWFAQFSKLVRAAAQFAREPTQRIRFNWVGGKRSGFGNGTLQTLEPAVFEALRAIRGGSRSHPLLTLGAKRTVDRQ